MKNKHTHTVYIIMKRINPINEKYQKKNVFEKFFSVKFLSISKNDNDNDKHSFLSLEQQQTTTKNFLKQKNQKVWKFDFSRWFNFANKKKRLHFSFIQDTHTHQVTKIKKNWPKSNFKKFFFQWHYSFDQYGWSFFGWFGESIVFMTLA